MLTNHAVRVRGSVWFGVRGDACDPEGRAGVVRPPARRDRAPDGRRDVRRQDGHDREQSGGRTGVVVREVDVEDGTEAAGAAHQRVAPSDAVAVAVVPPTRELPQVLDAIDDDASHAGPPNRHSKPSAAERKN